MDTYINKTLTFDDDQIGVQFNQDDRSGRLRLEMWRQLDRGTHVEWLSVSLSPEEAVLVSSLLLTKLDKNWSVLKVKHGNTVHTASVGVRRSETGNMVLGIRNSFTADHSAQETDYWCNDTSVSMTPAEAQELSGYLYFFVGVSWIKTEEHVETVTRHKLALRDRDTK